MPILKDTRHRQPPPCDPLSAPRALSAVAIERLYSAAARGVQPPVVPHLLGGTRGPEEPWLTETGLSDPEGLSLRHREQGQRSGHETVASKHLMLRLNRTEGRSALTFVGPARAPVPRTVLLPACRLHRPRACPRFPPLLNASVGDFSGGRRGYGGSRDLSDHRALVEMGDL